MSVFTLPPILRVQGDQGPHRRSKDTGPARVKQKYALVKHHDRVGV